jgi:hypothetical protein
MALNSISGTAKKPKQNKKKNPFKKCSLSTYHVPDTMLTCGMTMVRNKLLFLSYRIQRQVEWRK